MEKQRSRQSGVSSCLLFVFCWLVRFQEGSWQNRGRSASQIFIVFSAQAPPKPRTWSPAAANQHGASFRPSISPRFFAVQHQGAFVWLLPPQDTNGSFFLIAYPESYLLKRTSKRCHCLPGARFDFRVNVRSFIQISTRRGQAVDQPRLVLLTRFLASRREECL